MAEDFSIIKAILEEYDEDIQEAIAEETIKMGKKAKEEVKKLSPVGTQHKRSKRYKQGWGYSTERGRGKITVTVHNKTNYRLTHLLEKGHALRNGGRTRAIPHIKPVEEMVNKEYEENIENVIRGMKWKIY